MFNIYWFGVVVALEWWRLGEIVGFGRWRSIGVGQGLVLGRVWCWAGFGVGRSMVLGEVWCWAKYGVGRCIARYVGGVDRYVGGVGMSGASGCRGRRDVGGGMDDEGDATLLILKRSS
jgi:hypothetical protein